MRPVMAGLRVQLLVTASKNFFSSSETTPVPDWSVQYALRSLLTLRAHVHVFIYLRMPKGWGAMKTQIPIIILIVH